LCQLPPASPSPAPQGQGGPPLIPRKDLAPSTSPAKFADLPRPARNLALDLLRALAVLLVLGHHLWPADASVPGRVVFDLWHRGGWVGVDLFFVLSGFLVSGLLFAEYARSGRISPGRFYVRRGFKIYPAFFVFLAVSVAVLAWTGFGRLQVLAEMFFVQNYLPGLWIHTWSLAVEEHFYLALPLVLLLLSRPSSRGIPFARLPLLVGCVCLGVLGLRVWQAGQIPYTNRACLFPTHLRIDALFFGVLLSYFWHFYPLRFRALLYPWRRWLIVAGALLFLPAFVFPVESTPFLYTGGLTLFYLGGGALLVGLLLAPIPVNAVTRFLAFLGARSYSVYLWHLPVIVWGIPSLEMVVGGRLPFVVRAALYVAGSFAFGVLMAKLVENPALALRDRLFPARSTEPPERVAGSAGYKLWARPHAKVAARQRSANLPRARKKRTAGSRATSSET
jgi:peptidoglycan/LPS O-acetylase OafA/YrhL